MPWESYARFSFWTLHYKYESTKFVQRTEEERQVQDISNLVKKDDNVQGSEEIDCKLLCLHANRGEVLE